MAKNYTPVTRSIDVDFDELDWDDLKEWLAEDKSPDGIFDDDELKNYVAVTFEPEDVFEEAELEAWAQSHGFVKEGE